MSQRSIKEESKMEMKINDNGEIEIINKVSAQEYINNKLMQIDMIQQQINNLQNDLNRNVDELKALVN
jgi:hypothetical protein